MVCFLILRSVADDEHWQNLMSILVTECLCTADIVAPVITSDSPEGCMADDIQGKLIVQGPRISEFYCVVYNRHLYKL